MKKISLIIALIFLVGCTPPRRNCTLACTYENEQSTFVYCDSFKMYGLTRADVCIDGTKITIEPELIRPSSSFQ